jgi:hypothetical protein
MIILEKIDLMLQKVDSMSLTMKNHYKNNKLVRQLSNFQNDPFVFSVVQLNI